MFGEAEAGGHEEKPVVTCKKRLRKETRETWGACFSAELLEELNAPADDGSLSDRLQRGTHAAREGETPAQTQGRLRAHLSRTLCNLRCDDKRRFRRIPPLNNRPQMNEVVGNPEEIKRVPMSPREVAQHVEFAGLTLDTRLENYVTRLEKEARIRKERCAIKKELRRLQRQKQSPTLRQQLRDKLPAKSVAPDFGFSPRVEVHKGLEAETITAASACSGAKGSSPDERQTGQSYPGPNPSQEQVPLEVAPHERPQQEAPARALEWVKLTAGCSPRYLKGSSFLHSPGVLHGARTARGRWVLRRTWTDLHQEGTEPEQAGDQHTPRTKKRECREMLRRAHALINEERDLLGRDAVPQSHKQKAIETTAQWKGASTPAVSSSAAATILIGPGALQK
eukprot:g5564.t1